MCDRKIGDIRELEREVPVPARIHEPGRIRDEDAPASGEEVFDLAASGPNLQVEDRLALPGVDAPPRLDPRASRRPQADQAAEVARGIRVVARTRSEAVAESPAAPHPARFPSRCCRDLSGACSRPAGSHSPGSIPARFRISTSRRSGSGTGSAACARWSANRPARAGASPRTRTSTRPADRAAGQAAEYPRRGRPSRSRRRCAGVTGAVAVDHSVEERLEQRSRPPNTTAGSACSERDRRCRASRTAREDSDEQQ